MCSVSFIPRQDGFVLAMNRDELISRVAALPPRLHDRGDLAVLCPSEPSGGTWIGVNSAGMAFSLLNWHSQPDRATDNLISRGEVVRTLLCSRSTSEAGSILKELPLRRMNPFRLVARKSCRTLPRGMVFRHRSPDFEEASLEAPALVFFGIRRRQSNSGPARSLRTVSRRLWRIWRL